MTVELFRVILPVSDIPRAIEFYGELLALTPSRVGDKRYYFQAGHTILACLDPSEHDEPFAPNPQHLYFAVDDLDAFYDRAQRAGCAELEKISVRPWGERSFYARDPFGNRICFVASETRYTGPAPPR